ncbi:MAG: hypothetical protein ACM3U1_02385 [Chloroflexota bacterium]
MKYTDPTGNYGYIPYQGQYDGTASGFGGTLSFSIGGVTQGMLGINLWRGIKYSIDLCAFEFYLSGGVMGTFGKYLLSPTGGWGRGNTNISSNIPHNKLPRNISFRQEINGFTFSSLSESDKAKASANYTKVIDKINNNIDISLPDNLMVVAASSEEIKSFSAYHKDEDFLGGLVINNMEVDGEMMTIVFISTEYLLNPEGLPGAEYERADEILWERYQLEDIIIHEFGHVDGYCQYPEYKNLNATERENYAIYFRNKVLNNFGRSPQNYERVWPWQLGGWFNRP